MCRSAIWFGWSLCALFAGCPQTDSASSFTRELDQRLQRAADDGFSGAVLVRSHGKLVLAHGYGLADRDTERANTAHTAFDVGSIAKLATALAIYELDQRGVLHVSDQLGSLLPDVPSDKAAITLQDVLLHRAGFAEYTDTQGDFEPLTREQARASIFAQQLLFTPGSDEAYSNSGYTLLADVIQAVSGESYTDHVRRVVFEPAGMLETGFYSEPLWQRVRTAIGYEGDQFQANDPASWPYTWALIGNGGLVTTVLDLDRFADALWGEQILHAETRDRFHAEYLSSVALSLHGETVYGAAGAGDYGFGGVLIDVPARRTRVLLATNAYDAFDVESFAKDLIGWLLERDD